MTEAQKAKKKAWAENYRRNRTPEQIERDRATRMRYRASLSEEKLEQRRAWHRAYSKRNKDKTVVHGWRANGINLDMAGYKTRLASQKGCCLICNIHESEITKHPFKLVVDHDHMTGQVRGLLCVSCNAGLGNYRENIRFFEAAIAYLQKKDR